MNYHSVTRLALLIGAPGKEKNYLRGVPVDIHNVRNFLLSPNGGRWFPDEIVSLPQAQLSDVASIVQGVYVDYLFVYFSGHGYTNIYSNERMLCLQDCDVEDLSLLNNSPRQLIIADACRNYSAPAITGIPEYGEEPLHFDGESEVRNIFDRLILQSPHGRIIIHGTQKGQYSRDSSFGGHFTQALLHVATNINANENYTTASISKVNNYIPTVLQKRGNNQIPEVTYRTGNFKVPFAIGLPKPKYRMIPIGSEVKQIPHNNWEELALALLVLAAIGYSIGK